MLLEKPEAEKLVSGLMPGGSPPEEPVDLARFTGITPGAAEVLARGFRGEERFEVKPSEPGLKTLSCFHLDLSGLKAIDVESARALARWNPVADEPDEASCVLDLSGLRRSPPRVLAALAAWSVSAASASLILGGFRVLGPARAAALGRWSGGNLSSSLYLGRLAGLTPVEAAGLTAGCIDVLLLGAPEISEETAVVLGQAGCARIILNRLERIDPAAIHALGGLTPQGELRPEYASPEFARAEPLVLFLDHPKGAALQGLTPETAAAITALEQRGITVCLPRATRRQLRALR